MIAFLAETPDFWNSHEGTIRLAIVAPCVTVVLLAIVLAIALVMK